MESAQDNVETDSVVDLEVQVHKLVDPTDPIAELHAAALDKRVDPILAGSTEAMAVRPQTDVATCQAAAPEAGHLAEGFEPSRGATVVQPGAASEAIACRDGVEQSASYPIGYTCTLAHKRRHLEPCL